MPWLTDCPVCGHTVSINADKCPNCGEPLHHGVSVGGRKTAPIGLIPVAILQFILFWVYPLFLMLGYLFSGKGTLLSELGFYVVYTIIAVVLLIIGIRTSNKRYYKARGASVVTLIVSAMNTLGGGYMILYCLSQIKNL